MRVLPYCVMAAVWMQLIAGGDAVCCPTDTHRVGVAKNRVVTRMLCADCTRGTPFCSALGSCNMFGCNCDGGCKVGKCQGRGENVHMEYGRSLQANDVTRSSHAHDVIRAADVDGDGRMSLEEAGLHLGVSAHRERKSLRELDTDGDNFLSVSEIDN